MWKRSHIHQAHFWYYIISALNPVQKLSNLGISFKEDCLGWRCFIRLKSYPSTEKDFNVEKLSIICPYNYIMIVVRGTGVPRAVSRFLDTEMAMPPVLPIFERLFFCVQKILYFPRLTS